MALQLSLTSDMFNDDYMCLCIYLTICLVEGKMFPTKVVEEKHITISLVEEKCFQQKL
jgi:hypothetical protein